MINFKTLMSFENLSVYARFPNLLIDASIQVSRLSNALTSQPLLHTTLLQVSCKDVQVAKISLYTHYSQSQNATFRCTRINTNRKNRKNGNQTQNLESIFIDISLVSATLPAYKECFFFSFYKIVCFFFGAVVLFCKRDHKLATTQSAVSSVCVCVCVSCEVRCADHLSVCVCLRGGCFDMWGRRRRRRRTNGRKICVCCLLSIICI